MPPRKRRSFTAEYKVEAAHRVIDSGRSIAEVARELGIHETVLSTWVKDERRRIAAAEVNEEKPLDSVERAELLRLRRQVGQRVLGKSFGVLCRDAEEPTRFDLMAKYAVACQPEGFWRRNRDHTAGRCWSAVAWLSSRRLRSRSSLARPKHWRF